MDLNEIILNNIIAINGKERLITDILKIEIIKHKYSSIINGTPKLLLNDIILNNDCIIRYKCGVCGNIGETRVDKYLIKKTIYCNKCMKSNLRRTRQDKRHLNVNLLNVEELIKISLSSFQNEEQFFKDKYFLKVPNEIEFNNFIKNISEINNVSIINTEIKYFPFILTNHSKKYSPKVLINNELILLTNFKFKCENCKQLFNARNFKNKSMRSNCLCKNCLLCNKIFAFKKMLNINNENVVYQSNPEKIINRILQY